jgi:hypothetical protein
MHQSVMQFVQRVVMQYDLQYASVIEVGSRNVNGSARKLFSKNRYVGIDIVDGNDVDFVSDAHDMGRWYGDCFDVGLCLEMLEHDDAPWLTMYEMAECVDADGYLILTCRGFDERGCFDLHDFPGDHYRFSVSGVRRLLELTGWHPIHIGQDPEHPGVFAVASRI